MITPLIRKSSARLIVIGILLLTLVVGLVSAVHVYKSNSASALSGIDFNPGRIIDDSVFYNRNAMSATQVQQFLNSKVPACDTYGQKPASDWGRPDITRAQFAKISGWHAPPYTCLRDYKQDTPSMAAASGLCNSIAARSGATSAQIIKDVADACGINPQVLLVLLEKEQSLVTDVWPLKIQYRNATGFACPDTAPCDPKYEGFFYQVYHAARQFKVYQAYPNSYNYKAGRNNRIYWHPDLSRCGSSTVFIQNQATAALYIYTPYRPNQAALNNLYGTGDNCSSYGNRNFWRLFTSWFGPTTGERVYSWSSVSQTMHLDVNGSTAIPYNPTLNTGQKTYVTVRAKNTGNMTWSRSNTLLATSRPNDRVSSFSDSSWIGRDRAARMVEESVKPNEVATFKFTMTAPYKTGSYKEYFNIVHEGLGWSRDIGFYFPVNIVSTRTISLFSNSARTASIGSPNATANKGTKVYARATIFNNSQTTIPANASLATTNPNDRVSVLRDSSWLSGDRIRTIGRNIAPGATASVDYVVQVPNSVGTYQESLGLVVDGAGWIESDTMRYTINAVNPPQDNLEANQSLSVGQSLKSSNGYSLVLQGDGNLVLYSPTRAVWSTGTVGSRANKLVLQGDGNLVLYSPTRAVWSTGSVGTRANKLIVQGDGNLVLYSPTRAVWSTGTAGRR